MYDCNSILKLLYPYLDGELDVKECLRVQAHLKECHYCLKIFRQEQKFLQIIRGSFSVPKAPAELQEKIIKTRRSSESWNPIRENDLKGIRSQFLSGSVLAATAAILVLALAGLFLYSLTRQEEKRNLELVKVAVENHKRIINGQLYPDITSTAPAEIIKWLGQEFDFPVVLPPEIKVMRLVGAKLVHYPDTLGGRPSVLQEKKAALLIFESKSGKVSLLMSSPQRLTALVEKEIPFKKLFFYLAHYQGYYAMAWSDPKLSYVLVSNQKKKITEACRICHENAHPQYFNEFEQQI
jgi:mycothiol system anti-sigma-R factor